MDSVITFFWITIIFTFLKTLWDFKSTNSFKYTNVILFLFSIIFFIYLFVSNLAFTESEFVCGNRNNNVAFYHTVFPFSFIYLLGVIFLIIFPGWSRSFSNTFGLTLANMRGLGNTIKKWLGNKSNTNNKDFKIMVERIYSDPTVIINELDTDDIIIKEDGSIQWEQFEKLSQHIGINNNVSQETIKELIGYINIKNTVGQYIWILLLSLVTILVSRNSLLTESCYNTSRKSYDAKYEQYIKSKLGNK